jgi:hypothetical protein
LAFKVLRIIRARKAHKAFMLQPLLPFKIDHHRYPDEGHEGDDDKITEAPLEFRHKMEIHTIHTGYKCEGNKNCADDCEEFHDLVHLIAETRKVDVEHP